MIIAGSHFKEDILNSILPAGVLGIIVMLLPLIISFKSKELAIKLFPLYIFVLFLFTFLIAGLAMCLGSTKTTQSEIKLRLELL